MQNINIAQLNFISENGELISNMPPCLSFTKDLSFGVKGFGIKTQSIPVFIPKLYTNVITATYTSLNTATDYIYNFNDNDNTCIMIDENFNPSFNDNGARYTELTYPSRQNQNNLYNNMSEMVKYFHCHNFVYFLSLIESQIQTINNGVIFDYNTDSETVSISILKSYVDAGNTIAFNNSFFNVLPFIYKYYDGVMNHIFFNKKLVINLNGLDYYTTSCYANYSWFNKIHIGSEKSIIQPTQFPSNNINSNNTDEKKIIMSFRFIPEGVILPMHFQADNNQIAIFHKFTQDYNNDTLSINVYLQVQNKLILWKLNDGDNIDIDLLIYNTNS